MSKHNKFRVWHDEEMHEPPHKYVLKLHGQVAKAPNYWPRDGAVAMFYTGLDDAEDTPIYEGDVVEYKLRRGDSQRGCVLFRAGSYVVGPNGEAYLRLNTAVTDPDWETTVIGNKYEHPDLLEGNPETSV
jgi:hypothetical protein